MEIIGFIASILIGVSLGLIGGGGSILAIPILVYLFSINPHLATSYSLFIVGCTSLVGSIKHYRIGNLRIVPALIFACPSVLSTLFIRLKLLPVIPENLFRVGGILITKGILIMTVFAILMMAAAFSMIRKSPNNKKNEKTNYLRLAGIGLAVGLVTGFLGAGGGFLIIPALIFFAGLTMKESIGTSLLIIFINSAIGFSGDLVNGVSIRFSLLLYITLFALAGMFIGTALSRKIDGSRLKPAFGWFVLGMGIYILINEIWMH
jgi:uncharacterized membrane protein YfcA